MHVATADAQNHTFRFLQYKNPGAASGEFSVCYGWSADGTWEVPEYPRVRFGGGPVVVQNAGADERRGPQGRRPPRRHVAIHERVSPPLARSGCVPSQDRLKGPEMEIRQIWRKLRGIVPVSCYPLLAPAYRWDRRRTIRRLERHDADYLSAHPELIVPGAELRFNVVGAIDVPGFVDGGQHTAERHRDGPQRGRLVHRQDSHRARFRLRMRAAAVGGGPPLAAHSLDRFRRRRTGHQVVRRPIFRGARVVVNPPLPPLPFADGEFDLIWCGSVFTHLDEERQDAWLAELNARPWPPAGISWRACTGPTAGPACRGRPCGGSATGASSLPARPATRGSTPSGTRPPGTPATTSTSHWSRFVEIAAYIPQGSGLQDVVVAKRRD